MIHELNEVLLAQEALDAVDHPVFVVGTMRSGTGFLGLQLNLADNLIGCPFELRRIWHEIGKVSMAWDSCGYGCPSLDERFASKVPLPVLKEAFAQEVIKNVGQKDWKSGLRFLSKNPHLCNKIDLVSKLFPKAQFVWTIRRMEDVVCSLKNLFGREEFRLRGVQHIWPTAGLTKSKWRCFWVNRDALERPLKGDNIFPGGDITHLAQYWLESNLSMLSFYEKSKPRKMSIVPQERLFQSPDEVADSLERFLGLTKNALAGLPSNIEKDLVRQWDVDLTNFEIEDLQQFRWDHESEFERIANAIDSK